MLADCAVRGRLSSFLRSPGGTQPSSAASCAARRSLAHFLFCLWSAPCPTTTLAHLSQPLRTHSLVSRTAQKATELSQLAAVSCRRAGSFGGSCRKQLCVCVCARVCVRERERVGQSIFFSVLCEQEANFGL